MEKVKQASVAGQFYTADSSSLNRQISEFVKQSRKDRDVFSRLVIAPHAGYIYSGTLMSESIRYLPQGIKNVFIIAPSHHVGFVGLALSGYDKWRTPLGEIEVNQEINRELETELSCHVIDEAFAPEHAVEVEVPFLQYHLKDGVKIVPILSGQVVPGKIASVIERYYDDPRNAFIISSDLSHFLTSKAAKKLDEETALMIESNDIIQFRRNQACGGIGICGSVLFAQKRKYALIRAGMYNSGEATGDVDRVVGYGSWFLYEGSKEQYLKKYYSDTILKMVRTSISTGLSGRKPLDPALFADLPSVFDQWGASFVTLEIGGRLRGCIGSILANGSLKSDLLSNARSSAFGDPRFPPLSSDEFDKLTVSVSLLTVPVPLKFQTEEEMLNQVEPFRDGLIISDGRYRAVYLPSVWEQLPEKKEFLRQLKIKAGMTPGHFSKTFEASVFTAEYITEKSEP